jgi:hypothetical protein
MNSMNKSLSSMNKGIASATASAKNSKLGTKVGAAAVVGAVGGVGLAAIAADGSEMGDGGDGGDDGGIPDVGNLNLGGNKNNNAKLGRALFKTGAAAVSWTANN